MMKRLLILMILALATGARAQAVFSQEQILDFYGQPAAPVNPPTNYGRVYFDTATSQMKCLTTSGGNCLSSAGTGTVTSVGLTVNSGSSSGALAITGSPITGSGTFNLAFTGTNGDVMTFGASNAPTDSGTLLSALATLASPTFTGTPLAPTASNITSSTQLATTAFVQTQVTPNTSASPFITSPFVNNGNQAGLFSVSSNTAKIFLIPAPFTKTTTKVCYEIGTTADNTSATYDIGVYSGSPGGAGTLLGHLGPTAGTTFAPTTSTVNCLNWTGGSFTIPAGPIWIAWTTSQTGTAATLFGGSVGNVLSNNSSLSITTGGTLAAIGTLPALNNSGAGSPTSTIPWFAMW